MKVIITLEQKNITIPVSWILASSFIRIIPNKEMSKEDKKIVLQLIKVCKKDLKEYKGLEIVNVKSSDGTRVIVKA